MAPIGSIRVGREGTDRGEDRREPGGEQARQKPGGCLLGPRQPQRQLDLAGVGGAGVVPGEGLDDRDPTDHRRRQGEDHQRSTEQDRGVVHRGLVDRRVEGVDHGELGGLGRERSVPDELLGGGLERLEAGGAVLQADVVARADERVGVRLERSSAREGRRRPREAAGEAHRADHLEHRLGAVDLSALEVAKAEEVLLGKEPDRELHADRHVDLSLEVVAQDDLDDLGIGGGLREPTLEHDRLDDRRTARGGRR